MQLSPFMVGRTEQMAGRSIPGKVRKPNIAIAIKAPVLPADTVQDASPDFTASIARRMLDCLPFRRAAEGLSSLEIALSV